MTEIVTYVAGSPFGIQYQKSTYDPSGFLGQPLDIFNSWLSDLGNPALLFDYSYASNEINWRTAYVDQSFTIQSHPWKSVSNTLDINFSTYQTINICKTPSTTYYAIPGATGSLIYGRLVESAHNIFTLFWKGRVDAGPILYKFYTDANETIIYFGKDYSVSEYIRLCIRITNTSFDMYYDISNGGYGGNHEIYGITFDEVGSAIVNDITNSDTGGALYNKVDFLDFGNYRYAGAISESQYTNSFAIKEFDLNMDLQNKYIIDTGLESSYLLEYPRKTTAYLTCSPDIEIWKARKIYQIGDIVMPHTVTASGYYYEATLGGTSGESEPVWEIGVDSVTTDNTVEWTRKDLIVRPQIHGPVSSYKFVGPLV